MLINEVPGCFSLAETGHGTWWPYRAIPNAASLAGASGFQVLSLHGCRQLSGDGGKHPSIPTNIWQNIENMNMEHI